MVSPWTRRAAMGAVLLALGALIAITPSLRERPGPTIQSAPVVVLDLRPTELLAAVHGAFDQVRYAQVVIRVTGLANLSSVLESENDTYGFEVRVPRSMGFAFEFNVSVFDLAGNGFRWRGAVVLDADAGGEFMAVVGIADLRSVKVYPPATFRTLIPELGMP